MNLKTLYQVCLRRSLFPTTNYVTEIEKNTTTDEDSTGNFLQFDLYLVVFRVWFSVSPKIKLSKLSP